MLGVRKTRLMLPKVLFAGFLLTGFTAAAAPIEGSIGFGGGYNAFTGPNSTGSQTNNLNNALSIQTDDSTIDSASATGDFASVSDSTPVDSFGDFNTDGSDLPIEPIWQVTSGGVTYSMDLTALAVKFQDSNSLVFEGDGIMEISGGGFDPTLGEFDASFNTTGSSPNVSLTFSSTSASTPEPVNVPTTLGLLGAGLIGLGVLSRRRRPEM